MEWNGHVLVPRDGHEDFAKFLAGSDWQAHFDTVELDSGTWDSLERVGFWETLNQTCDTLIDRYEEAWIDPTCVPMLSERAQTLLGQSDGGMRAFLERLVALAGTAQQRNVPVIFAF
jgi:hypothetical protein